MISEPVENAMLWLVLWSFELVLAPVALGLAWQLISWIGRRIGLGLVRAVEGAEPRSSLHLLRLDPPSGSIPMAGRTQRLGTGRSWAPDRR
jgi:hypothetical protein